ncbi:tyrosine-type recombinase/integrase [Flavobacterium davisii]|uniref:Tyrosine-type recombinase/integrase n=1 Tax=Flavobacterium davisii TaxID=2906077 RepID=A0ABW8PQ25_9FLAO
MEKFENSINQVKVTAFIDYKPAELKVNKEWIIVYYSKNPTNKKLERQRVRVPILKDKTERLRHAKKIVLEINKKLVNGWSPYLEETGKNYKSFKQAILEFLKGIDKQVADSVLRADTKRSYSSNCNLIQLFVETKAKINFALEINRKFCIDYLDWIYIQRSSSPRTRNNHLTFLKVFCSFLVQRGILAENPAIGIAQLKITTKKRVSFEENVKRKIKEYFKTLNNGYPTLCLMTYYCFIRNTELRKLKVKDIDLDKGVIFVSSEISKNKRNEAVTIPNKYLSIISQHIKGLDPDYFVFSKNKYLPGKDPMSVRKIANGWDLLRQKLNLGNEYQFYGLKDTGITDLLNSGVPAIKVRNQARHYDIKITEIYAQRRNHVDSVIKESFFSF